MATIARTRANDLGDPRAAALAFAVADKGLRTSAYEVAATLKDVFAESDVTRIRFGQPLHVEAGDLRVTHVQVVDRDTGARAPVRQDITLSGSSRRYFLEGVYEAPLTVGRGVYGVFARMDAAEGSARNIDQAIGARLRLDF